MTIKEIIENKEDLIKMKKSAVKNSDSIGSIFKVVNASKSINKDDDSGVLNKTFIGNTYYWMDSHDDVHVGNTFKKSLSESKNILHLHDHEFKITSRVGDIQSVEEKYISWRSLGVNKDGDTIGLVVNSNILKDRNSLIFNDYKSNKINQHSVGMQYTKIELAVADPNYEQENEVWNKYIDSIGNKEKAIEKGYFWAVKEAKLYEVSAVLQGSNELTGMYEPSSDTQSNKNEPSSDTQIIKEINNFKF